VPNERFKKSVKNINKEEKENIRKYHILHIKLPGSILIAKKLDFPLLKIFITLPR